MALRGWLFLVFLLIAGCRQGTPATQDDNSATNDVVPDDTADVVKLTPRCIKNWPVDPKATPLPSLSVTAPQVLWTKEVSGPGYYVGDLAMAGERLAYADEDTIYILDRNGVLVNAFTEPSSSTAVSGPVADTEGNFYFGNAYVTSVTPNGEFRWRYRLGPDISQSSETAYTSQLTLSPEGILYFGATDGFLYALWASNGEVVWQREVGVSKYGPNPFSVGTGIGDTVFTEGGHYNVITGDVSASPVVDGIEYGVGFASYSSLVVSYMDMNAEHYWLRIHALDRCGERLWSFPTDKSMYAELAGFNDSIVAIYGDEAFIYSAGGERQVGPAPLDLHYFPKAIGADGTIYYTYCTEPYNTDAGEASVQAYSPSLELLWSVELGSPCVTQPPVLADDGVLYVLRSVKKEVLPSAWPLFLELTAIQTASPGLANTAYPTLRANNRRTGWIGGPQ